MLVLRIACAILFVISQTTTRVVPSRESCQLLNNGMFIEES